ncbi:hypothetical protein D9M68_805670 [compost metagenome]
MFDHTHPVFFQKRPYGKFTGHKACTALHGRYGRVIVVDAICFDIVGQENKLDAVAAKTICFQAIDQSQQYLAGCCKIAGHILVHYGADTFHPLLQLQLGPVARRYLACKLRRWKCFDLLLQKAGEAVQEICGIKIF